MSSLPDSISIRRAITADAGAIASVHIAVWRATYVGIVAQSYLDALSIDDRSASWERRLRDTSPSRSDVFVAETRGEIIGFVAGGPHRVPTSGYDAQLHAIYLASEAQGLGTGRKLARVWAAAAVDRGFASAVVDVLARNPARGFYEHLDARYLEDIEVVIGGEQYTEARYVWADLGVLAG